MRLFNLFVERRDYKQLYNEIKEIISKKEGEVERLQGKVADAEYETSRVSLDLEDARTELNELRYYMSKKTKSASDQLHEIAEKLREAEEKAEKYDKYLKSKRARNQRYRAKAKASRQ